MKIIRLGNNENAAVGTGHGKVRFEIHAAPGAEDLGWYNDMEAGEAEVLANALIDAAVELRRAERRRAAQSA